MSTFQTSDEKLTAWQLQQKREREWLAGLKVGDEVAISGGFHPVVAHIARETPAFWIAAGNRYSKSDGRGHGCRGRLFELSQDIKDDAETRRLRHELDGISWSKRPLAVLRAVKAILDNPPAPEKCPHGYELDNLKDGTDTCENCDAGS